MSGTLTFNAHTGNFHSDGRQEIDNNAVPEKGTARATDHTRVQSYNASEAMPDTSLYFKHPTSERQLSAAEARDTNAIVMVEGMATSYASAVAAGIINSDGTRVGAQPVKTEPDPQPSGEGMVEVGDDVPSVLGESETQALGLVNATVEADSLVDMVLSAADTGEFDTEYVAELSEAMGSDSSSMANHLMAQGNAAFDEHFGDTADMARDYFYSQRNTPEVRNAIAAFINGQGMSGFQNLLNNL